MGIYSDNPTKQLPGNQLNIFQLPLRTHENIFGLDFLQNFSLYLKLVKTIFQYSFPNGLK